MASKEKEEQKIKQQRSDPKENKICGSQSGEM
jgi:hypothetical protein